MVCFSFLDSLQRGPRLTPAQLSAMFSDHVPAATDSAPNPDAAAASPSEDRFPGEADGAAIEFPDTADEECADSDNPSALDDTIEDSFDM